MTQKELEASNLLTHTFMRFISRVAIIGSFRLVAHYGSPLAKDILNKTSTKFVSELISDPEFNSIFDDPAEKTKYFEQMGGCKGLAETMTSRSIEEHHIAVDAASLVFMHSILDDVCLDYCRVTAIIAPDLWEKFVLKMQIRLEDIKLSNTTHFEDIFTHKISEYIDSLDEKSLPEKVDRIYEICRPPANFSMITGYQYDRDRIQTLDEIRHNIIHGDGPVKKLPSGEQDIEYLHRTAVHLLTLISITFKIKLNTWTYLQTKFPNAKPHSLLDPILK